MNHTDTSHVVLKKFHDFGSAAGEAKWLATHFQESVQVRRTDGWEIVVSRLMAMKLACTAGLHEPYDDPGYFNDDARLEPDEDIGGQDEEFFADDNSSSDWDNELEELRHEIFDDAQDYSRSEEDGWFYSDDD